ncbi:MAG: PHP domain-containing protein [Chloroflexi bacterium RBG_13_54_9]|nr:MAG: PHP domain-containing protein [Chloroflexi bacterium RBG_13_54_9]
MVYDFHTHTFHSDGSLSPIELIRRAVAEGYSTIALTDHVGIGYLDRLIHGIVADCALAQEYWNITAIPGVELTHLPVQAIDETAKRAKELGAKLVVVHGETITEPVEKGTNRAAVQSSHVDILAHPGLLSLDEAEMAAAQGVFLEISARRGHSLTNGHVTKLARLAGAKLLLNTDAHDGRDLLTPALARAIAQGAGLEEKEIEEVLIGNPHTLLRRLCLPIPPQAGTPER